MEFTCIMCPVGCHLTVTKTKNGIVVSGNACPRGELFGKSEAQRHEYNKWLLKKLIILCTRSEEDIQETDTFEFLGRGDEYKLYSLRRPEFSGNPRILFASLSNEDGSVYIMLLMFKELHTGDYQRMIPVAKKRMEEILTAIKGDLE